MCHFFNSNNLCYVWINFSEETKNETATPEELALKAYDFEEGKLVIDSKDSVDDKKKRPRKLQKLGKLLTKKLCVCVC